jgi:hypothetical protein
MAFDSSDTDPTAQRWPTTPPLHGPPSLPSRTSQLTTPIIAAPSDSQTRMMALSQQESPTLMTCIVRPRAWLKSSLDFRDCGTILRVAVGLDAYTAS